MLTESIVREKNLQCQAYLKGKKKKIEVKKMFWPDHVYLQQIKA